jgi:signal recognition particle GTPase
MKSPVTDVLTVLTGRPVRTASSRRGFSEAFAATGLDLTQLDSSAKSGIVFVRVGGASQ